MNRKVAPGLYTKAARALLVLGMIPLAAAGQAAPPQSPGGVSVEERLAALERRIQELEAQLLSRPAVRPVGEAAAQPPSGTDAAAGVLEAARAPEGASPPATALTEAPPQTDASSMAPEGEMAHTPSYSGYMEMHLNQAKGEPTTLDFHRFVLLFGHTFSPRIKFWSELEIEHALIEGGEESGELEVEQAYLDFFMKPELNFRAGILLAPVGIINERHEPPAFFGVERPFVDTFVIPTTWFDAGFGIHGDLGHGISYKLFGMAPPDATGFNAGEGIREGRQGAFQSRVNNLGVTGRVEYRGVPRLTLGSSFFTANTGAMFRDLDPRLNLFEFDGRYRLRRFDFRGEFAQLWISRTAELNQLLLGQTGVNPNIARSSLGYYLEAGYHALPPRITADVAPFVRFERFNTQHRMESGFDPLPQFNRTAWTLGVNYRPHPDVALKLDYQWLRNKSEVIPIPNRFNVGIGWWF